MLEPKPLSRFESRVLPMLVIAAGLLLSLLLLVIALSVVAVHQRVLPPPTFAIRFGRYELMAPCPRGILCDKSTPFYALWWGEARPNGRIRYKQLFFVYLKSNRQRAPASPPTPSPDD